MYNPNHTNRLFQRPFLGLALLAMMVVLVLTGCDNESVVNPELNADQPELLAAAGKADRDTRPIVPFSDPSQEVGTSTLIRNKGGVSFRQNTTALTPGDVVTLWIVIFNNPEYCVDGCDIPDFFIPEVQADALYSAGRVIGPTGKANYAGHRNVDDSSGSIFPAWLGLPSPGLIDTEKAEIHFLLHSHGQKIQGLVDEMLHTFNAGCGPVFMGIPVPEELGTHGPNTCEDVQFTIHPATP